MRGLSAISVNKKIIGAVSVPSAGIIGLFGSKSSGEEYQIMVNYNGQADLLLSLQIPPDYYPYQFQKQSLYDYLTNIDKYIVAKEQTSSDKKTIKKQLQSRIDKLLSNVKEFGPSLWNEEFYKSGIVYRNSQFWNNKKTNLLFLEQYISDDYTDIRKSYELLPTHKKLITTNHRAARDPYTIFSKKIFDCFNGDDVCQNVKSMDNNIYNKFKNYMDNYDQENGNSIYRFGRFIDFWNNLIQKNKDQLEKLKFHEIIDKSKEKLFSLDSEEDQHIAKKYLNAVFTHEEVCLLNKWFEGKDGHDCKQHIHEEHGHEHKISWNMHYLNPDAGIQQTHHPSFEQHVIPGTAPLSEGSQKDIIVFLYQFAAAINSYTNSTDFQTHFKDDYRKEAMAKALNNAYQMSQNLNERIAKIRDYFKKIGVVDSQFDPANNIYTNNNSKTFTILAYPPNSFGLGEAIIQSMSKFPWLYKDIGLKQPIPSDLKDENSSSFSVDDNGWWWKLGNSNLSPEHMIKFKGTTDTLLVLASEDGWNLLKDSSSHLLSSASSLLKESSMDNFQIEKIQGNDPDLINNVSYPISHSKYHLWNEGLRSPIALNLLLDNLVDIFQRQYHPTLSENQTEYEQAMDWGNYWHNHFLQGTNSSSPS